MYQLSHLLDGAEEQLGERPAYPAAGCTGAAGAAAASGGEEGGGGGGRPRPAPGPDRLFPSPGGAPGTVLGQARKESSEPLTTLLEKVEGCRHLLETLDST